MVYTQYRDIVDCEFCDHKAEIVYFKHKDGFIHGWDLKLLCKKCAKAHMRATKY